MIATNAWAAALRPLRNKLFVISSDMIATEPIPDRLDEIGWTQGEAITDSLTRVCYYRTTAEGRIAFGKGGGSIGFGGYIRPAMHRNAAGPSVVVRDFHRYYPMLRTVKITHDWAGPIDRTSNSLPIFGRLYEDSKIYYGVGWSGNGVGPSVVGGKILASLSLGQHDEWSECGLVAAASRSFPPEPIRFVGAHIVREALIRKESAEALEKPVPGWQWRSQNLPRLGLRTNSRARRTSAISLGLDEHQPVAAVIPHDSLDPVRPVGRWLRELHTLGAEIVIGLLAIVHS